MQATLGEGRGYSQHYPRLYISVKIALYSLPHYMVGVTQRDM